MTAIRDRYGFGEHALTQGDVDATHPGFTITCRACGSTMVYVENSLGASAESGGWGSVDLICLACSAQVELVHGSD